MEATCTRREIENRHIFSCIAKGYRLVFGFRVPARVASARRVSFVLVCDRRPQLQESTTSLFLTAPTTLDGGSSSSKRGLICVRGTHSLCAS